MAQARAAVEAGTATAEQKESVRKQLEGCEAGCETMAQARAALEAHPDQGHQTQVRASNGRCGGTKPRCRLHSRKWHFPRCHPLRGRERLQGDHPLGPLPGADRALLQLVVDAPSPNSLLRGLVCHVGDARLTCCAVPLRDHFHRAPAAGRKASSPSTVLTSAGASASP